MCLLKSNETEREREKREKIMSKVILETTQMKIAQTLCCILDSITCLLNKAMPETKDVVKTREREEEEEGKKSEKSFFLLMNKGNFIFCVS